MFTFLPSNEQLKINRMDKSGSEVTFPVILFHFQPVYFMVFQRISLYFTMFHWERTVQNPTSGSN